MTFFVQGQTDSSLESAGLSGPLPPLAVETGVVHVHGLGVDPGDGMLYAATHSGLFRLPASLSLHGEADFHALHAAHGSVYGYDSTSGTFMVSRDRKAWDRRARLPMRDFAVSPDRPVAGDPEALTLDVRDGKQVLYVAATDRGILGSADGGMSFTTRYQE